MASGTTDSGQGFIERLAARERQSPDWRPPKSHYWLACSAASATSASYLCVLCVPPLTLNFQLSTVNAPSSLLLHSSTTPHDIAPLFSATYKLLHRVTGFFSHPYAKCRVCTPLPTATSEPILEGSTLNPITPARKHAVPALTHPAATAYNATSLMTISGSEWILGPPSRRRAAKFLGLEVTR
jgi:hypothetical protein